MPYDLISQPVPGPTCFAETSDAAVLSQAAILLILAGQIRAAPEPPGLAGLRAFEAPPEEETEFPVPRVAWSGERYASSALGSRLAKQYGPGLMKDRLTFQAGKTSEVALDLAVRLYKEPAPETAATLFTYCFESHPHVLARAAAAAALLESVPDYPARKLLGFLEGAALNEDELVAEVSATLLGRLWPDAPVLRGLQEHQEPFLEGEVSHTTLLVHGTWARGATWWQPGGDFHTYARNEVRPDLYTAPDRYEWTGGWSDAARAVASQDLLEWVNDRALQGLELFAHSHGGNVCMLAGHAGLSSAKLVLLSCPVRWGQYRPNPGRMPDVVSIRVRLDLVILADGGGQRFPPSWGIRENVLPVWFDHKATRKPEVWRRYGVPSRL